MHKTNLSKHKSQLSEVAVASAKDAIGASTTTTNSVELFRLEVLEIMMEAGIPIGCLKSDRFRGLLSRAGYTVSKNLSNYIPVLRELELNKLREEIKNKKIVLIWDTTTASAETLAVVGRYWATPGKVSHRCLAVRFLDKSPSAKTLFHFLTDICFTSLHIRPENVVGLSRDGANVNTAAVDHVHASCPDALDIRCLSHLLDRVGTKLEVPTLDAFLRFWSTAFVNSPASRDSYKAIFGSKPCLFSPTR